MDYVCKDPNGLVRAANVKATLDAFTLTPALGFRIIERYNLQLDDLRPDHFIPVQLWLDALRDIENEVGPAKLRHVGRNVVENADIPAADTESILMNLDDIYYLNHKGDVGHYRTSRRKDGTIEVRCETPYPRNFEWGLVEGFCRNKVAHGKRYLVEYIDGPRTGDLTCTLLVRRRF